LVQSEPLFRDLPNDTLAAMTVPRVRRSDIGSKYHKATSSALT